MTDISKLDLTIKVERDEEDRKDPTTFLPEEPMVYEIKAKKKKKKKKKQEDPFKGIEEKPLVTEMIFDVESETFVDPEVNIKVENIEVELDFNDFATSTGLMVEGPTTDNSQEPEVKLEQENKEALILTFENIINDKNNLGIAAAAEPAVNHICQLCHLAFHSPETLQKHQRRKHKIFRLSFDHICDYCGMEYEQKSSLDVHIKRKHGPNSKPQDLREKACEICALVFKGEARLRMHMRRKHGSFEDSFKHKCKHCGLTYENYRSLVVHSRRKHSKKKPVIEQWFNCPFCPKIFTKRETYTRHIQRKHQITEDGEVKSIDEHYWEQYKNEAGEIACKECPLVFSSVNYLKLHMRRKHSALKEDFRLKCIICNLSYDKIESLKRHVRRKHNTGTYCSVCNKDFESRELYLNHSHKKMVQECSICGLLFPNRGGLAKHLRCTHKIDSPKVVFCSLCNEGFHDKRQLKPHLRKVHLKVSYTCVYCKKQFKSRESYKRHVIYQHPNREEINYTLEKCEQCSETFPDEFELCKHINIAHRNPDSEHVKQGLLEIKKEEGGVYPFQCIKCPETYPNWEELKIHYEQLHYKPTQCQICGHKVPYLELQKHIKQEHSKYEETKCKYCEFKTTIRASLTQHMLRHKNATTLNCDFPECRYKTFYEGAMQKHKIKHKEQGVKLQCSQCPYQTMNKYILRYHEEAHFTGKKKYACNQCDYSTILPANLVQHKYKHSTEKRFKCDVCPFATKYNTSLRWHVKKKHCDLPSFS